MHSDGGALGEERESRQPRSGGARFWLGILMLTSAGFALEAVYSVESNYAVPALLESGVQGVYASVLWAVGPVLGLLFQSYLGAASDRCKCSWGRRRPFVLGLAISMTISVALFAYGSPLFLPTGGRLALMTTVVAFVGMDFSADQFGSTVRMYLLDSVSLETSDVANYMYLAMLALGSCVGSLISAIDWDSLGFGGHVTHHHTTNQYKGNLEYQIEVVFGIVLIIFVACIAMTLCSVDEKRQISKDSSLDLDMPSSRECSRSNSTCLLDSTTREHLIVRQLNTSQEMATEIIPEKIKEPEMLLKRQPRTDSRSSGWNCVGSVTRSLRRSREFVGCLSLSMKLLWAVAFLDWIVYLGKNIFFTDYVGSVVYGGSPTSDDGAAMSRYEAGIRMACWCKAFEDVLIFFYSLILEWLSELTGHKVVLVGGHFLHFAALGLAVLQPSIASAVLLSITDGIFVANLETIPYALILYYKVSCIHYACVWSAWYHGTYGSCALCTA